MLAKAYKPLFARVCKAVEGKDDIEVARQKFGGAVVYAVKIIPRLGFFNLIIVRRENSAEKLSVFSDYVLPELVGVGASVVLL